MVNESEERESPAPGPVPASITESTRCPRCGTENRAGVTFCKSCGQRLVAAGAATVARPSAPEGMQACARCGTLNRTGTAFCQNCGANLRSPVQRVEPVAGEGYVPPAVGAAAPAAARASEDGRAVLGPIVLLIGAAGVLGAWLLPFLYAADQASLFERSFGRPDGYGVAFWNGYPEVGSGLADQAYFGFAAPVPVLGVLLLILAVAGLTRARPGPLQVVGLLVALVWAIGLGLLFVLAEVVGRGSGDFTDLLRSLTPAGIIFLLVSLIVVIGVLTRFARS